jgi:cytochrome c556
MISKKTALAALLLLSSATMGLAYATDPTVRARQQAMDSNREQLKVLMPMLQGKADFDAAAAQAAFAAIATTAGNVPTLFKENAHDPETRAKPAIWQNWDDFTAKANALKTAAEAGADVDSLDALKAAMGPVGGACKACHTAYKTQ